MSGYLTSFLLSLLLLLLENIVVQFHGHKVDEAPVVEGSQYGVSGDVQILGKQVLQAVKHNSTMTVIQLKENINIVFKEIKSQVVEKRGNNCNNK